MSARIKSDAKDRTALRQKLELCIDPLSTDTEHDGLVNIVTRQVSDSSVNADNAVDIGTRQMETFERG